MNGYYDDTGNWQRTKFCFVDCGATCTCGPPGGLFYSTAHDKRAKPMGYDIPVDHHGSLPRSRLDLEPAGEPTLRAVTDETTKVTRIITDDVTAALGVKGTNGPLCAPSPWPSDPKAPPLTQALEPIALERFQAWVAHRWGQRPKEVDKAVMTLGLMGEIAEVLQECVDLTIAGGKVSEHVKKEIRGSKNVDTQKLVLELGDVLHYLVCIANQYGINMSDVMAGNVDKLLAREKKSKAEGVEPYGVGSYKP